MFGWGMFHGGFPEEVTSYLETRRSIGGCRGKAGEGWCWKRCFRKGE